MLAISDARETADTATAPSHSLYHGRDSAPDVRHRVGERPLSGWSWGR